MKFVVGIPMLRWVSEARFLRSEYDYLLRILVKSSCWSSKFSNACL